MSGWLPGPMPGEKAFTMAYCTGVLPHIPEEDRRQFLQNAGKQAKYFMLMEVLSPTWLDVVDEESDFNQESDSESARSDSSESSPNNKTRVKQFARIPNPNNERMLLMNGWPIWLDDYERICNEEFSEQVYRRFLPYQFDDELAGIEGVMVSVWRV
jgi:hypothetical protein